MLCMLASSQMFLLKNTERMNTTNVYPSLCFTSYTYCTTCRSNLAYRWIDDTNELRFRILFHPIYVQAGMRFTECQL